MKLALFLFLVFILEDKYGLSVSSLIRLVSCIGLGLKFCAFGALMCVIEFRCVVNLPDPGVAVTGPGRCKRDEIEAKSEVVVQTWENQKLATGAEWSESRLF